MTKMQFDHYDNKISVIIPTYNTSKSLKICIDSVLNQSAKPKEIFVINDGSTDDTSIVAKSYDKKITYIEQKNQGQGSARNQGLKKATGEYIAFLDSDDFWLPNFLKDCSIFLKTHKEAIAVWTAGVILIGNKRIPVPPIMERSSKLNLKSIIIDNFFEFWAEQGDIQNGSVVIRHDIIKKAGLQREDLRNSQDVEYWALIATYGKWGFIPKYLYINNSRQAAKGRWRSKYKQRRELCPDVESWEKRLIPRLKANDLPAFKKIRGRVAAGYTHYKIMGGNIWNGLKIVKKYGTDMPQNNLVKFMKFAIKFGNLGWIVCCFVIHIKEHLKSWRI